MSRFSIRIQVFALAGAFLTLMVSSVFFGVVSNTRVGGFVVESSHTAEIDIKVSQVQSNTERALLNVLMIDRGEQAAFDGLEDNLTSAVAGIDTALVLISEYTGQQDVYLDVSAALSSARDDLAGLLADMPQIRVALGHERSRDFRNRVIPLLQGGLDVLAHEHSVLSEKSETASANTLELVSKSTLLMSVALAVSTVIGLGLALAFGRMLVNPIQRAATSVGRIAAKDYETAVSDINRKDEMGEIARQLDILRNKMAKGQAAAAKVSQESDRRIELFETLGHSMKNLKSGALQDRIVVEDWDDLGGGYVHLCQDFNELAMSLEELVESLRGSAKTVEGNSCELSTMSDEMSRRAEVQAATLEESAAALDELSESVQNAACRAQEADDKVGEGRRRAEEGGEVMTRAMEAMSSIAASSEQITQIIGVIDDIAFQTNLLALNAGVEAARAGETGKGFAVVASEVRGLAQRAAESASEIKDLVLNSTAQVEDGEKLVQQTSVTLGQIVESVTSVSEMVAGIAIASREQASAVKEINVGVAELDKVTQQNAAMVGNATASSQALNHEATRLTELLERFAGGEIPQDDILHTENVPGHEFGTAHYGDDDNSDWRGQDASAHGEQVENPGQQAYMNTSADWDDQPNNSEAKEPDIETWSQDVVEPDPVPMEPHQPAMAANADQWKDF
ncbi:methyl-accepting chemotaxis protein [Pelagimonas varians]|uniref:Methyl-accepting chemotaxis protein I n=1 Tax=Pelagimonas varians TaxID=696760 RepID=A0A238KR18_9RHOB|nr:HAMP domain-containing methyl-accepting chemotaxis protein [Pelagimonas varians]PYG28577.1 methyl-accepting chemotaxis protein [Pelagimonas varians]SMX45263.1 Methyl-accepting chemotaxis protein I [Pelagimonas varians]